MKSTKLHFSELEKNFKNLPADKVNVPYQLIFSSYTFLTKSVILVGGTLKWMQANMKTASLEPANFELSKLYHRDVKPFGTAKL